MTQVLFAAATAPLETDLDANFTELYTRTLGMTGTTLALGAGGITPSSWSGAVYAFELANGTRIQAATGGTPTLTLGTNSYFNGTNDIYKITAATTKYVQTVGQHQWSYAGSGTAGGTVSWTQGMTLDLSGNLLLGVTSLALANANALMLNTGGGLAYAMHASGTASGSAYVAFAYNSSLIGSITQSGTTAVLYNTTSDHRLKASPAPLAGSGAFIDALKPCTWTWTQDGSAGAGFIAHEFAAVSPTSVSGTKDAVDGEGKPIYQAMDSSSPEVIANIVAELQDLRRRVALLEGH